MTITYHRETHHSKMFKMFAFGFETWRKTIAPLIYRLNNKALLFADHISISCHFSLSTYHTGFWQTCSCVSVSVCVSRCWSLVHWCGFHAARGESEWCILLWCLAAQIVAARHLPSCWQLYFPVHHTCTRGLSCCDTKLWSSHQTRGLPTDQTSVV